MSSPSKITLSKAIQAIDKSGALLVFPLDNRPKPESIWSKFYKDKMRWEWDEDGDDRVMKLWQIKTDLSTTRQVVYSKWFQGRATYFSKETFTNLLAYLGTTSLDAYSLPNEASQILEVLEMDSPQSTKQIKLATELRGKTFERVYEKSMKALFDKLWVVGFGEVDDGAFPSLSIGSTKSLFEDLWEESKSISKEEAKEWLINKLGEDSLFLKYAEKVLNPPAPKKKLATPTKRSRHINE